MQEKGSVAEVPDERTVRYYLSEGLISPASERRGSASVYGYRQELLELLAVEPTPGRLPANSQNQGVNREPD